MLRASSEVLGHSPQLRGVVDVSVPINIPLGPELLAFTDAVVLRDTMELSEARSRLAAAASDAIVARAAAVAGAFDMFNRLVDSTGIPYDEHYLDVVPELGLAAPAAS